MSLRLAMSELNSSFFCVSPSMSQTNKVKTKLSVLSLEGPHGLQLRIKSRHRLLEAISGKTNSPVLVADGHIELHLEVSVDREKCSAKAMRKSGLLRSLLAFFRDVRQDCSHCP